jgi:hypothetical protein
MLKAMTLEHLSILLWKYTTSINNSVFRSTTGPTRCKHTLSVIIYFRTGWATLVNKAAWVIFHRTFVTSYAKRTLQPITKAGHACFSGSRIVPETSLNLMMCNITWPKLNLHRPKLHSRLTLSSKISAIAQLLKPLIWSSGSAQLAWAISISRYVVMWSQWHSSRLLKTLIWGTECSLERTSTSKRRP